MKQNLQKHPDSYFEYWGNQTSIRNYVEARHDTTQEILLILDFFPYSLYSWLPQNQAQVPECLGQLESACQFLEQQGILHRDAHFMNLLTNGELFVLGDFGLWLDPDFELETEEREFLSPHNPYDIREIYLSLAGMTYHLSLGLKPGEKPAKTGGWDFSQLFENLDSGEFLKEKGIHPQTAKSIPRFHSRASLHEHHSPGFFAQPNRKPPVQPDSEFPESVPASSFPRSIPRHFFPWSSEDFPDD